MTTDRGKLVPKVIADVNGVIKTVWVNPEDVRAGYDLAKTKVMVETLGRSGAWGGAKGFPADMSWGRMSPAALMEATAATCRRLDDPKELWGNIDRLTQAVESRYGSIALQVMEVENGLVRLRDTWLKSQGADLDHPETYQSIGGDEGYESFQTAFGALQDAFYATRQQALDNGESVRSHGRSSDPSDLSRVEAFDGAPVEEKEALRKLEDEAAQKAPSEALPTVTHWNSMSEGEALRRFDSIVADVKNPNTVWANIDSLQGAFHSDKSAAFKERIDWHSLMNGLMDGFAGTEMDMDVWDGAQDELRQAWDGAGRASASGGHRKEARGGVFSGLFKRR